MITHKRVASSTALLILAVLLGLPALAQASFGVKSVSATPREKDGAVDLRAGSRPYEYTINFEMNQDSAGTPEGTLRDLIVDLPPGLFANPLAVPRCTGAQFEGLTPHCPGDTQVGFAVFKTKGNPPIPIAIYNLVPPLGVPAMLGTSIVGLNSYQEASLRPDDYGVSVSDITVPTNKGTAEIQSVTETIWGCRPIPVMTPCANVKGPKAK